MLHNDKNTPPFPVLQPPLIVIAEPPPSPEEQQAKWQLQKIEML